MKRILLTGGSGFFGGILKRALLADGIAVDNIDLVQDDDVHPLLQNHRGDIRDAALLRRIFSSRQYAGVFHCAAILAHDRRAAADLWSSNVDGTRQIAEACRHHGARKLVFLSSNCLWGSNPGHPIAEREPAAPVEEYGRSKLEGERVLAGFPDLSVTILRCPTIIDSGRLGLLAILFEFIADGKRVWVVGEGLNRYQFLYAGDLVNACRLAFDHEGSELFHVGSDHVPTLRSTYQSVIDAAGTPARVASLPRGPAIAAMKLAHRLGVSPLGPYHYGMIAEDFEFDTSKIRQQLGWLPTLTNEQMLVRAFEFYRSQRSTIHARRNASAHSVPTPMGAIRLLKWLS